MDFAPIILTLKLATVTTVLLFFVALPLAWWLARSKSWALPLVQSLVGMPLVLPPTVLGFYFLLAFSPTSGLGGWLNEVFGLRLAFSFPGLVIASMVYSLPFMVHPLQAGLEGLPQSILDASYLMGKSRWETLRRIELPNIRPALLAAVVLSFAHTIGEFGVVLMIGGNIPGETRVASIAIYDEVESLNYAGAHLYSLVLFAICFSILLFVYAIKPRTLRRLVP
ncbi:molybdate ABC transporter permease subunit [Lewinella sp. 4G2]|uniref:molybdate ABC transporter permease subunit n=1 Tax=Lewinella sp. 4G2 TaxID=1803372 RepID=UPI0007B4F6C1|nr:molybdate ABC transporter permease subunit [Lewinella sp. 4G2]OAV44196.1 molybdenum ABC transporter permease subunit [Lewinella sp. 4G2]